MTTLASHSCGKACNEDADFTITFLINSLTLTNEGKYSEDEKFLTITWDGNVFRTMAKESMEEFNHRREVIYIHCTPMQLSRKLKTSPILMNLMAYCEDLGTIKFPLAECFCDAVLCAEFNSQVLNNDFKFRKDEIEHGAIDIDLKIERMNNQPSMFEAIKKTQTNASKRNRKKSRTQSDSDDTDDENDATCGADFSCPGEIPENCKKHFDIDEHLYRIINGHLMNVKDKRGFCGEVCETTSKLCKELQKSPLRKVSSLDLQKLFQKKTEKIPKIQSNVFDEITNLRFCKRMNDEKRVDEKSLIGSSRPQTDGVLCKTKKKRAKHIKGKACKSKSIIPTSNASCSRENSIKKKRKKSIGKYSYNFGNSYPFHRSTCNLTTFEKVPSHMGWRYDKVDLNTKQQKKDWQPGKINKIVRVLMKHFLSPYPYDTISLPKVRNKNLLMEKAQCCDMSLRPMLQITKRDGEISIQMRPLKDNKELATDCNPYLNCSPLKFMIKRHPEEIKKHRARKLMKSRGYQKECNCSDIKYCRCISSIRKEMFIHEMRKVSRELNMKNEIQYEDVHDSSDSEIDFEFTPPSVLDSSYKCKPDVAHSGTQYEFEHFIVTKKEKEKYFGQKPEAPGCDDKLKGFK